MYTDYFYSGQIRRFIIQFMRIMSNFQVEFGSDEEGNLSLRRATVVYGDSSRQAASILKNNSENTISSIPMISCYISDLSYDRERVQEPFHVSQIHIRQREYNQQTGEYGVGPGNAFTVDRLMPVPYLMKMKVDIWTSNLSQKLQLLEQIAVLFNPSMDIQNSDSYIDWTSLTVVELKEVIFSSKTIPVGTEDPLDIATMVFEIPIWITAPSKIKKLGVVEKIVNSIYEDGGDINSAVFNEDLLLGTRHYYTPMLYGVWLKGNQLQLLKYNDVKMNDNIADQDGVPESWAKLLSLYGRFINGISQIRLQHEDLPNEVVGTASLNPTQEDLLIFDVDIDTLPTNTLAAVDSIVNPIDKGPGSGLPNATIGQRYLITQDIGASINQDGASAWKSNGSDLVAKKYDIIEYTSTGWIVSFSPDASSNKEFVTSIKSNIQYFWNGTEWVKSIEGIYKAGSWSLVV